MFPTPYPINNHVLCHEIDKISFYTNILINHWRWLMMFNNKKADDLFWALQKQYKMGQSLALAIVINSFPEELQRITPGDFRQAYLALPGKHKDTFFQKIVSIRKNFDFWKDCTKGFDKCQNPPDEFFHKCQVQMGKTAENLAQLSYIYDEAKNVAIQESVLKKMNILIKKQYKRA